jgi:hypothetical protein
MTDPSLQPVATAVPVTGAAAPSKSAGRVALFLGLGLAVAGIVAYGIQIQARYLSAPWYMPSMATLGVVLIIQSLRQARTVWRFLSLGAVTLLAAAQWGFMFTLALPAYSGPIAEGKPFPEFATVRADGKPFARSDLLQGDQTNVLVFFRGRW